MNKKERLVITLLSASLFTLISLVYYFLATGNFLAIDFSPVLQNDINISLAFTQGLPLPSGAIINNTIFPVPGRLLDAYGFNGINSSITLPKSCNINDNSFSVESWVKINSEKTSGNRIVSKDFSFSLAEGWTNQFVFWVYNETWTTSSTINVHSSSSVEMNKWYHVVGVYNYLSSTKKSTLSIYVNGELKGTTDMPGKIKMNNNPVIIGSGFGFFDGTIDEVTLYNRALSADEILERYQSVGNIVNKIELNFSKNLPSGIVYDKAIKVFGRNSTLGAYNFSGKDSYMELNSVVPNSQEGTFIAIVKPSSINADSGMILYSGQSIGNGGGAEQELHIGTNYGKFSFYFGSGAGHEYRIDALNYAKDKWYYVAGVYKNGPSGFIKLYVNGSLVGTNATSVTVLTDKWAAPTLIGKPRANMRYFNGTIEMVKVLDFALTDEQILTDYNSYKLTETANPLIIPTGDFCIDNDFNELDIDFGAMSFYINSSINYSINGKNYSSLDKCINSTALLEYYCEDNRNKSTLYNCPDSCLNNSCYSNFSYSCIDSDGINYTNLGTIERITYDGYSIFNNETFSDYCDEYGGNTLTEFACNETDSLHEIIYYTHDCASNELCLEGKCINTECTNPDECNPLPCGGEGCNPTPVCEEGVDEDECRDDGLYRCTNGQWLGPIEAQCTVSNPNPQTECEDDSNCAANEKCTNGNCVTITKQNSKLNVVLIIFILFAIAVLIIIAFYIYFFLIKKKNKDSDKKSGAGMGTTPTYPPKPPTLPPRFPMPPQNLQAQYPRPQPQMWPTQQQRFVQPSSLQRQR